jgi:hypothetical protein
MKNGLRILIVSDGRYKPLKMYLDQMPKLTKGFIRLGHDVRLFGYSEAISSLSPFKSKKFSALLYKKRVDKMLIDYVRNYKPDIVYVSFPDFLNADTVKSIKDASPSSVLIGGDGDPWPQLQKGRIETAKELDILIATNDGQYLQDYRDAGVSLCVFMPNMCDPDIDHRYQVGP